MTAGFIADEVIGRDMRRMADDEANSPAARAKRDEIGALSQLRKQLEHVQRDVLPGDATLATCLRRIDAAISERQAWFLSSDPRRGNEAQDRRIEGLRALGVSQADIGRREGLGVEGRAIVEQRLRRRRKSPPR